MSVTSMATVPTMRGSWLHTLLQAFGCPGALPFPLDLHQSLMPYVFVFFFFSFFFFFWFLKAIEDYELEKKSIKERTHSSPGDRGKNPFSA